MGIYGAINSAVSGLTAQSRALENISGNVANSQTTGYKRLDTTFADLVSGGGSRQATQVSGTTYATSRATNTLQGDIAARDVGTYMAINGEGYFIVTEANAVVDGTTSFEETDYYTRAGDFERDQNGYLVNSSGYYLQGFELNPDTGNPVGDTPEVVQISDQPLPANKTTAINYQANLPPTPETNRAKSNPDLANSDQLNITGSITATSDITNDDNDAFVDSSISGGSITIYNQNGTAINVETRWAKTADDTWNVYYASDRGTAGTDAAYTRLGQAAFNADGSLNAITAGTGVAVNGNTFEIASLQVGDVSAANVNLNFGSNSLTQFAANSGAASSVDLAQDGYPAGELVGIAVDSSGRVNASYSNSQTRALYEIPLATFEAEFELRRVDGAAFAATSTSGAPVLISSNGNIVPEAVELSNADIATEFSKLIVTQQAYSANSRIVTSADEMLDSALNMVR
ncbi:flagellar basal body FlaE domain protein [Roseibium sp. TrichSKD4]|uniref:flagellar hook protein FlgE n=1 Tax=Roseibium sp. TrichSKD4 TaxID=744980 RepID=UPI0001E57440|nr:flagellar hook protein FlgE [Roseibium sp. TrichSKD4]EFO30786.1 flagellar basal body FlaE domain protein [Roseibium sp. TrichSKD4]